MFKNEEYSFLNIFTKNKIYNLIIFTSFISSLVACSQALTKSACALVKSDEILKHRQRVTRCYPPNPLVRQEQATYVNSKKVVNIHTCILQLNSHL